MGIVRDLYYARKMSAGLKLPAPTVALLIKRLRLAAAMGGDVTKTVSGSPAHITDALAKAALSVLVSIEPIQDLHGYANPWPAGGGINKAKLVYKTASASTDVSNLQDNSVTVFSSNTSAGYRYAQFALLDVESYAGQTLTFTAKAQQVTGSSTPRIQGRLYDSNGSAVGSAIFEKTGTSITHTFTLPATIDSGVTFRANLYCNSGYAQASETNFYDIQVEVSSTAHDFAPYENICPISGLTGLSVYRTGNAQCWDEEWESGIWDNTAVEPTKVANIGYFRCKNLIPVLPNTAYYFKCSDRYSNYARFVFYDAEQKYISRVGSSAYMNHAFTTPANAVYMVFWTGDKLYANSQPVVYDHDISINYPSTDTSYHAYNGNTYAVDWTTQAGTVYGGTLDVVTGVLTVDHASVDMGTLSWTSYGGSKTRDRYITSGLDSLAKNSSSVLCSIFRPRIGSETIVANMAWIASGQGKTSATTEVGAYASASAFKTAMSGQQLVYELATPLTYQLTPQEVQMLLGENYVWSSSGDTVSVTYYAEGNANTLQSLNILLGGNYSNPKTADDVSDKEALEIILGGNK